MTPKSVLIGIVVLLLVTFVVIGLSVRSQHTAEPAVSSSPSGSAVPTPNPTNNEDSIPTSFPISDQAQPSDAQVWQFEQAYNTISPNERMVLLKPIATPQYLLANKSVGTDISKGLSVQVDTSKSAVVLQVDPNKLSCTVITHVMIETFRDGKSVSTYKVPVHATLWINTKAGWKVAQELGGS